MTFRQYGFTPAFLAGLFSFVLAVGFLVFQSRWWPIPLLLFLIGCGVAPFLPSVGFFLPVISRGQSGKKAVALTFDDGPHPKTTPKLLHLLTQYNIKATFFITGKNAHQHPDLVSKILSDGHLIGNHTWSHDNFIMLKSCRKLEREIVKTQEALKASGIISYAFRPPVAITNPKLGGVLKKTGMFCVNYSLRGFDAGNRRIKKLSARILRKIQPDDIILLHDSPPENETQTLNWLDQINSIVEGIHNKGFEIVPLDILIEKPVMVKKTGHVKINI